jgi:hypothetical protein
MKVGHNMNMLRTVLAIVALALGSTGEIAAAGAKGSPIAAGDWGGDHISMVVTAEGADLEFDCGIGHIQTPLVTDASGQFKLKGTYRFDRPAAAGTDENAGSEAIYTGKLKGDTLKLEMEIVGQPDHVFFQLERGQQGRLTKCA